MNTGQMMLVIGAFALLSTIVLSINRSFLDTDQASLESQAGMMAVSLCQGEIETLAATDFDSLSIGTSIDTLLTPFEAFVCSTKVDYVLASAPNSAVAGPTQLKRVSVTVSNQHMTGEITLSAIVGDY